MMVSLSFRQFLIILIVIMNYVKKVKQDRTGTAPISLSSKRTSLNNEQLLTPLKLDLSTNPLQNTESEYTNKNFFHNMKSELSNIKSDFEKLIRKETTLKSEKEQNVKSQSMSSKPKCASVYRKDEKRPYFDKYEEPDKLEIVMQRREEETYHYSTNNNKLFNLEKHLPSTNDPKYPYSRTMQLRENYPRAKNTTVFDGVDLEGQYMSLNPQRQVREVKDIREVKEVKQVRVQQDLVMEEKYQQKEVEIVRLKEQLKKHEEEISVNRRDNELLKVELETINQGRHQLLLKMSEITNELASKLQKIAIQQTTINSLTQSIQQHTESMQQHQSCNEKMANMQAQFQNERNFFHEKFNELLFHNQNLGIHNQQLEADNHQLANQNQMLKDSIVGMQNFIEDLKLRCVDIENGYKKKMDYLQKDLQEYQKREDMFAREIEKLNSQIAQFYRKSQAQTTVSTYAEPCPNCLNSDFSFADISASNNEQIAHLRQQSIHFKQQIAALTSQLEMERNIKTTLTKKYDEQLAKSNLEHITKDLEEKMNGLIDENGRLKNQLNYAESSHESLKEQNRSYLQQIELYEEREKFLSDNKKLASTEWEEMMSEIDRLQEENKRLAEEIEYLRLKKEVDEEKFDDELSIKKEDNVIALVSSQLQEIENLRTNLSQINTLRQREQYQAKSLREMNNQLKESLMLSSEDNSGVKLKAKNCQLHSFLQKKTNHFMRLRDILFQTIIVKVGKKQQQDEIDYYLNELDVRFRQIDTL